MPDAVEEPRDRARRLHREHALHKTIAHLRAETIGLRAVIRDRDTTIYQLRDELLALRPRLEERDTTIFNLRAELTRRPPISS